MTRRNRFLALLCAAVMVFQLFPAVWAAEKEGLDNFAKTAQYTDGQFADVKSGDWFNDSVRSVYELGLMVGSNPTTFNPNGDLTIAEALVLADKLHSIYHTGEVNVPAAEGEWYQSFVNYAIDNGIIKQGEYKDYTKKATRANFANLIYTAMPKEAWKEINSISALPDVTTSDWFATPVFALYNAGILRGSDKYGTFRPNSNITRGEVAAIITHAALPETRSTFTLEPALIYPTAVSMNNGGSLYIGETHQFKVTFEPSNTTARMVTWSSSNPKAVSVSTTGLVTAVAEGKATITATTSNGIKVSKEISTKKADNTFDALKIWILTHANAEHSYIVYENDSYFKDIPRFDDSSKFLYSYNREKDSLDISIFDVDNSTVTIRLKKDSNYFDLLFFDDTISKAVDAGSFNSILSGSGSDYLLGGLAKNIYAPTFMAKEVVHFSSHNLSSSLKLPGEYLATTLAKSLVLITDIFLMAELPQYRMSYFGFDI